MSLTPPALMKLIRKSIKVKDIELLASLKALYPSSKKKAAGSMMLEMILFNFNRYNDVNLNQFYKRKNILEKFFTTRYTKPETAQAKFKPLNKIFETRGLLTTALGKLKISEKQQDKVTARAIASSKLKTSNQLLLKQKDVFAIIKSVQGKKSFEDNLIYALLVCPTRVSEVMKTSKFTLSKDSKRPILQNGFSKTKANDDPNRSDKKYLLYGSPKQFLNAVKIIQTVVRSQYPNTDIIKIIKGTSAKLNKRVQELFASKGYKSSKDNRITASILRAITANMLFSIHTTGRMALTTFLTTALSHTTPGTSTFYTRVRIIDANPSLLVNKPVEEVKQEVVEAKKMNIDTFYNTYSIHMNERKRGDAARLKRLASIKELLRLLPLKGLKPTYSNLEKFGFSNKEVKLVKNS